MEKLAQERSEQVKLGEKGRHQPFPLKNFSNFLMHLFSAEDALQNLI